MNMKITISEEEAKAVLKSEGLDQFHLRILKELIHEAAGPLANRLSKDWYHFRTAETPTIFKKPWEGTRQKIKIKKITGLLVSPQ